MALLAIIIGSLSIRYTIFLSIWILTGHSFWVFPSLLSDDIPITECLVPRLSYDTNKDDHTSLLKRGSVVGLIMLTVYLLGEHGPDRSTVKMFTFRAHDQVLSMLKVQNANLTMITDATEDIHGMSDEDISRKAKSESGDQQSPPKGPDVNADMETGNATIIHDDSDIDIDPDTEVHDEDEGED